MNIVAYWTKLIASVTSQSMKDGWIWTPLFSMR